MPYADRLGSWEDHTLSWLRMRSGRSSFHLIRYEDLLSDPVKQLKKNFQVQKKKPLGGGGGPNALLFLGSMSPEESSRQSN